MIPYDIGNSSQADGNLLSQSWQCGEGIATVNASLSNLPPKPTPYQNAK
jgi:hypothetical protein